MATRAMVKFYDEKNNLVCVLYRNGDGFPWIFGQQLALTILGVRAMTYPETETDLLQIVSRLASEWSCLISEQAAEETPYDFKYIVTTQGGAFRIHLLYPTLDRGLKHAVFDVEGLVHCVNEFQDMPNTDDHLLQFEDIVKPRTVSPGEERKIHIFSGS